MNSSICSYHHVFLTGPPGVGKTTLIQKVSQELLKQSIPLKGFYTSELRQGGKRIGFDVISFDGNRSPLSRIRNSTGPQGPRVGNYVVLVEAFESVALPVLQSHLSQGVTIIDEVGKMELLSSNFETAVKKLFTTNSTILGTLPLSKGNPLQLVEFLRTHPSVQLVNVSINNRDGLAPEIVQLITSIVPTGGK